MEEQTLFLARWYFSWVIVMKSYRCRREELLGMVADTSVLEHLPSCGRGPPSAFLVKSHKRSASPGAPTFQGLERAGRRGGARRCSGGSDPRHRDATGHRPRARAAQTHPTHQSQLSPLRARISPAALTARFITDLRQNVFAGAEQTCMLSPWTTHHQALIPGELRFWGNRIGGLL